LLHYLTYFFVLEGSSREVGETLPLSSRLIDKAGGATPGAVKYIHPSRPVNVA
jgi:hypothetical protein